MLLRNIALAAASLTVSLVAGQSQRCDNDPGGTGFCFETYFDPVYGAQYGWIFPPTGDTTYKNEFIGQFAVPIAGLWAGITLGEGMNNNLLIAAWPYDGAILGSTRQATDYVQPTQYVGPTLTTLATTINSTHWKWTYRCQNCTTWTINGEAGSVDPTTESVFGWAYSTTGLVTPSNAQSNMIQQHDDARLWAFNTPAAISSNYAAYITGKAATTTVSATSTSSTTTTSAGPTVSAKAFDYVVVGAGDAGLVVADRLTENGKNVLLIERGGPSTYNTGGADFAPWLTGTKLTRFDTPGLFEAMFDASNPYWWCNDISVFAGCLIGGGAAINGALYWYPPDADFALANGWPSGWQTPDTAYAALAARLPSTEVPSPDGKQYLTQVFTVVQSLLAPQGYTQAVINSNPNFKDHVYGHPAFDFVGGQRTGPMATYFQTAKARSNLTFWQWTYVTGLVRSGGTITGVRTNYTAYGGNGIVPLTAKGRVVLSAGTYGSARILFASGIGPTDQINNVLANSQFGPNLPPSSQWINLPVGYYVSDNPSINLVFTHPSVDSYDNWAPIWASPRPADAAMYKANQTGVFAGPSPKLNFWTTVTASDGSLRYMQGTARPGASSVTTVYPYNASNIFTITVYLSNGLTSRGRIGIDSTMYMSPIVNPWFQDPEDKTAIMAGITTLLSTIKSVPNLTLITPDNTTTMTDYVNNYPAATMDSNHWIGSARIGTSPTTSVVDSNTKVWNTTNLFVVDASIIPGQPMGNPHAAIMVVAEIAVPKILALAGGA
ncbi:hypothetical protein FRB94_010106 [Tulasnella sp. JGI-2019a]|nr:hypothetical protein FRB94_010106 [Tulasnella sp. JGI-2019a]KAG9026742.1 hypothetical protein FRB95_008514 [Tulasnella sp. JGI-2019a]